MAFSFTGVCSDCNGTAHAELVLKDYTLGDAMEDANLVSFTYDGTNLLSGFTITPSSPGLYLYGVIDGPFPAAENVIVFSTSAFFESSSGGSWCAGLVCGGDQGSVSQWSIGVAAVPEAATWAMMVLGFGGIGFALSGVTQGRRQQSACGDRLGLIAEAAVRPSLAPEPPLRANAWRG
jgi:hypothetical protein